jgi:hypothetical protein
MPWISSPVSKYGPNTAAQFFGLQISSVAVVLMGGEGEFG